MSKFINDQQCINVLLKSSQNHKIKLLILLTKFKQHDYITQVVTPEIESSH